MIGNIRKCVIGVILIVSMNGTSSNSEDVELTSNHCEEEISAGFDQDFKWSAAISPGVYHSDPMCYNENSSLIERRCKNSMWDPVFVGFCFRGEKNLKTTPNATEVEAILTFEQRTREMHLITYSPEYVRGIYCYTYGISRDKHVQYKLVFDSRKIHVPFFGFRDYTVHKLTLEDYPNEYWCKIFLRRSVTITTEKIVGFRDNYSNEYTARIVFQPFEVPSVWFEGAAEEYFVTVEVICEKCNLKCRLMKVFEINTMTAEIDVLIHITSEEDLHVIKEYYKLKAVFDYSSKNIRLNYIRSSEFCLPENTNTNTHLHWSLTPLSATAKPKQLCLRENGAFMTRQCTGSFLYGAEWERFKQKCSETAHISENSQLLYEILENNNITADIFRNVSSIIENASNVSTVDIALFSDGLYETSIEYFPEIETDFVSTISKLNQMNQNVLRESQTMLNSTDKILDSVEIFFMKKSEIELNATDPTRLITSRNFIIFITKPFISNVTGIALYGNTSTSFSGYDVIELSPDIAIDDLSKEDLELAVHMPQELLDSLTNNLTLEAKTYLSLIITVYYNDSMFNENNSTNFGNSRIIGVTMPGLGSYLQVPIPLIFRPLYNTTAKQKCGYWSYGRFKKGRWSTKGGQYVIPNDTNTVNCAFSHLTHFALLVLTERSVVINDAEGTTIIMNPHIPYNFTLNVITVVGCAISLIGVIGIFLTAIAFRRFREKLGSKILLQLSITIILEIILTQLAGLDNWNSKEGICTFVGVLLHYVVLSKFSWMFVIAVLQYLRFVKVLGAMPKKLLLKSNLMGWLFPVFPVVVTICIYPTSYTSGIQNFCYPKDNALYFGLITPISIIISSNILVFAVIMISISRSKAIKYDKSGHMLRRQTYLAILLFFMLGIPWIFGILAEILREVWFEIIFVYLFCLTATIQGFVLFAFYVVFDKETRLLWTNYIKSHI